MLNRYVELNAGTTTLWRGTSMKKALSVRCNNRLRYWQGKRVHLADVTSTRTKPMGMQVGGLS